jgi:hypothetical protein
MMSKASKESKQTIAYHAGITHDSRKRPPTVYWHSAGKTSRARIALALILLATPSASAFNVPVIEGKLFALCSHLPSQTYWQLFPGDADEEASIIEQQEEPPKNAFDIIAGKRYTSNFLYWIGTEDTCKGLRAGEIKDIQKAFVQQITF